MYTMDWNIVFDNAGTKFKLGILAECEIVCSVDNLADSATIILPEAVMNQVLNIENKISRGTSVLIELGYDGALVNEFEGYVQDITTNDSTLKIICEDALFLFRVGVQDEQFKLVSVKKIAQQLISQIDPAFKLVISGYGDEVYFEKFVIHQATGFDVLKKIQEETKANIFFNTRNKELHIHPPYEEKGGEVIYSMQQNIEKSTLEFKRAIDKKLEITVESVDLKGKVKSITIGNTGGDKKTIKSTIPLTDSAMLKLAQAAFVQNNFDGYSGSFDGWLVPFVKPTYSATILDQDYPYKDGTYYVVSVKTNFSESGGVRTITPGIKL